MRSLTRLGVAVAATAMASAAALTGATAGAAEPTSPKPVFNSPSSVSVAGKGTTTKVTYTSKSDRDLVCTAFAGPERLIADIYSYAKKSGNLGELPTELNLRMLTALTKGQLGIYMGGVEKSKTAELTSVFDFLETVALPDGGTYAEVEVSAGIVVPAGLVSLDSALTGLGSSGSVAETTGSLAS